MTDVWYYDAKAHASLNEQGYFYATVMAEDVYTVDVYNKCRELFS